MTYYAKYEHPQLKKYIRVCIHHVVWLAAVGQILSVFDLDLLLHSHSSDFNLSMSSTHHKQLLY